MEVRCQLHAPAALPPRQTVPGTHCIGCCVDPRAGLDATEKKNLVHLLGIELRYFCGPVSSIVTIPTELSRSQRRMTAAVRILNPTNKFSLFVF
jgi:hypothetical protein